MNFIKYNIVLLLSGFPAILIFSVGVFACLAPLALFAKMEKPPLIVVILLTLLAGAFQIYFWGLWSAYCVAVTYKFTIRPAVTWDWLYFITGFFDASSIIAWLSYKEQEGESYQRQTEVQRGTMYYAAVAWIAYIVFAIWPSLITPVYGWATNLLNLTRYIKPMENQFDLAEKPGDRIVPYSINRDRVKELEGKIYSLAELIGTPPQEVRRQYFDAIETVSGMDVDRLQAIM